MGIIPGVLRNYIRWEHKKKITQTVLILMLKIVWVYVIHVDDEFS